MRATLVHNPKAGDADPSADALRKALRRAGYRVTYRSTKKKGWAEALEAPADLVIAAGGDGTVAKVAEEVCDRGVPLAILPLGTANNVAESLGIRGEPQALIDGWSHARRRVLDVGVASGPWGERRFLEGVGLGVFAQAIAVAEANETHTGRADPAAALRHDAELLRQALGTYRSRPWRLELDGDDLSGEGFLLEVLNLPHVGPRLRLAPQANAGDGRLHVVRLGEAERERFDAYLARLGEGIDGALEVEVRSGRRVHLQWDGAPLHVDDVLFAEPAATGNGAALPTPGLAVDVRLEGRVEVLVADT